MSSLKSFSTETSERYARALFELAKEKSELESIEHNAKNLIELYNKSEDLKNFFKNPTKDLKVQDQAIDKISEMMKFSKTFKNFLLVLVKKRRIFFLSKIIQSFIELISKKKGELRASLISSKNLTKDELKKIGEELSKAIGFSINLDYKLDENLIGGLKIQVGSLMIDSSIKNKLKKYEQLMVEN